MTGMRKTCATTRGSAGGVASRPVGSPPPSGALVVLGLPVVGVDRREDDLAAAVRASGSVITGGLETR